MGRTPHQPTGEMTSKPVRQPVGVIIFTANPLTPPKKLKLEINVLIFGQILNILTLIQVTRVTPTHPWFASKHPLPHVTTATLYTTTSQA